MYVSTNSAMGTACIPVTVVTEMPQSVTRAGSTRSAPAVKSCTQRSGGGGASGRTRYSSDSPQAANSTSESFSAASTSPNGVSA